MEFYGFLWNFVNFLEFNGNLWESKLEFYDLGLIVGKLSLNFMI